VEAIPHQAFSLLELPGFTSDRGGRADRGYDHPRCSYGSRRGGDRGQPAVPGSSRYSRRDDLREEQMGQR